MGKRYKTVSEMIRQLSEDKEFGDKFDRQISGQTLSKTLFAMRCSMGITQSEIASKMNCTQSRISKLEKSGVDAIKVSDLIAYAQALGLNLSISFHKEMTSVESVRFHALQIKKHLDYLADLSHRDDDIFKGVKDFYSEYLVNILRLFKQSVEKLPKESVQKGPVFEVYAPTEISDDEALLLK